MFVCLLLHGVVHGPAQPVDGSCATSANTLATLMFSGCGRSAVFSAPLLTSGWRIPTRSTACQCLHHRRSSCSARTRITPAQRVHQRQPPLSHLEQIFKLQEPEAGLMLTVGLDFGAHWQALRNSASPSTRSDLWGDGGTGRGHKLNRTQGASSLKSPIRQIPLAPLGVGSVS